MLRFRKQQDLTQQYLQGAGLQGSSTGQSDSNTPPPKPKSQPRVKPVPRAKPLKPTPGIRARDREDARKVAAIKPQLDRDNRQDFEAQADLVAHSAAQLLRKRAKGADVVQEAAQDATDFVDGLVEKAKNSSLISRRNKKNLEDTGNKYKDALNAFAADPNNKKAKNALYSARTKMSRAAKKAKRH